jgi:uncharacterized paraquat-inducible protein A
VILKHIGFGLTILAIACFVPGILLPMFALNMDMAVGLTGASFNSGILNKELSILATVTELWRDNRFFVAVLIFGFSILVPIAKTLLVIVVYFIRDTSAQQKLAKVVAVVGKWSMADVFVVAVFLAILSTNHANTKELHELGFFGMKIAFEVSTATMSAVGQGFYYFVGYCILSLLGSQLILKSVSDNKHIPT